MIGFKRSFKIAPSHSICVLKLGKVLLGCFLEVFNGEALEKSFFCYRAGDVFHPFLLLLQIKCSFLNTPI